jgi:hypothetical protein
MYVRWNRQTTEKGRAYEPVEPVRADEPVGKSGLEGLRASRTDHVWVAGHYEELLRQYEDERVAVESGRT